MKQLDPKTAQAVRADARALEERADNTEDYPEGTRITRPNRANRIFNLRLTDRQYAEIHSLAQQRHLPVSTMARAWLLERLDQERPAS